MCLDTSKPVKGSPTRKAYKLFYPPEISGRKNIVKGNIQGRLYEIGKLYRDKKRKSQLTDYDLNKYPYGFHAYSTRSGARHCRYSDNEIYEVEIGNIHTKGEQDGVACIVGTTMKVIKKVR